MHIPFLKCHGSGNDFVMIDEAHMPSQFSSAQLEEFIRQLCDRQGPIGSDGVLVVATSKKLPGRMIMYNTDGSEAEMCGNGIRCVARKLFENQGITQMEIETKIGSVFCEQVSEMGPGVYTIATVIGPVNLEAPRVPIESLTPQVVHALIPALDSEARFTALSLPNPHLIAIVPHTDRERLTGWGQTVLEHREIFPNGINVSMVQALGKNHIFVTTFERGCGLTAACGTAIASSTFVSCLEGVCEYGQPIKAQSPGGVSLLKIPHPGARHVHLTGNATYVYQAIIDFDESALRIQEIRQKHVFQEENQAYEAMLQAFKASH